VVDFSVTAEDQLIVDNVSKFIEREVRPLEEELVRRGLAGQSDHLTRLEIVALQKKGRESGFWGLETPAEYGGLGLAPITQSLVWEELGRSLTGFHFGGGAMNVMYQLNEEQKKEYLLPTLNGDRYGCFALSEPGVGSDARGLKTTAIRDGRDWILNGEKTWITGGGDADYAIVFARTSNEGDPEGISAFLVDRAMGYTSRPVRVMASHEPASLVFEDVRVPKRNLCGEINQGFQWAMHFIYQNRAWLLPSRNIGTAERLLEMGIDYAEQRKTFGRKLIERENIMWMIAEAEINIRAAKLLVWNVAWQAANGLDFRQGACIVKVHAARTANKVVDDVLQIHGGMGLAKEMPIERLYRNLRVERIYEGSDEINLATIIRNIRKGYAAVGKVN
jgi:acyl-CoA dehydrogenase